MAEPTRKPRPERPLNPRQGWVNNVSSKYYDLVPEKQRSPFDALFGASDKFWKAKDMSAKGTARALCMGALGMDGVDRCSKPFDKSLRVSSRPEHRVDAGAFYDELDIPRPRSMRKAEPESAAADLIRRIDEAGARGIERPKPPKAPREKAPPKPKKEKAPPEPRVKKEKPPKREVFPGEDRILITVEHTETGEKACVSLARIVRSAKGTAADVTEGIAKLRALQPGQSVVIGHERFTLDCPERTKAKPKAAKPPKPPKEPKPAKAAKEKKVKEPKPKEPPKAPKEKKVKAPKASASAKVDPELEKIAGKAIADAFGLDD